MSEKFSALDPIIASEINQIWRGGSSVAGLLAGATINGATLPVAVYQNTSDNEFYNCDANDTTKLNFVGFAISNGTDGNSIDIQFEGIVKGFTGLSEGVKYYVQDDGTIGTSQGTYRISVGIAISETELLIKKKPTLGVRQASFSKDTDYTSQADSIVIIKFSGHSGSGDSKHSASITVDGVVVAQEIIVGPYNGMYSTLTTVIPKGKVWRYTWGSHISADVVSLYPLN